MTALAPTLQAFFTTRLTGQLGASPHTVAAYRDTWRMFLRHLAGTTGTPPHSLDLSAVTAQAVSDFLAHLENGRGNSVATRNARLAAIHSFFGYAAFCHPEHAAGISQIMAIPSKRHRRADLTYLTQGEADALLAAPDPATRAGRRDHAILQLAITAGLRVSELTGLSPGDIHLANAAHVASHGKGRKNRITPLDRPTTAILRHYIATLPPASQFLFPTRSGTRMSRDAVATRLTLHAATASATCPSLATKTITPHTLRHTCAMRLLAAGIDSTVIALWFGCAARRSVVLPAQRAEMRGEISGSNGLPESEKCREQQHARKPAAHAQAYGVACRGTRVTWRKLDCLNPNLQKVQMSRPPERRLTPVPVPAEGCPSACRSPLGAGAMPCRGIQGDEWGA